MPVSGQDPKSLGKFLIKPSRWVRPMPVFRVRRPDPGNATPRGQAIHESRRAEGTIITLPASPSQPLPTITVDSQNDFLENETVL